MLQDQGISENFYPFMQAISLQRLFLGAKGQFLTKTSFDLFLRSSLFIISNNQEKKKQTNKINKCIIFPNSRRIRYLHSSNSDESGMAMNAGRCKSGILPMRYEWMELFVKMKCYLYGYVTYTYHMMVLRSHNIKNKMY